MNELLCTDVENAWKLVKINIVSNEPEVARTPRRFHIWCCGSSWKINSYTLRRLAVSYPKYLKPEKIASLYFVNACSNCSLDPSLCPSSCSSQREQACFLWVLLKCYTPLKTQEVWRPKGRIIFLSRRPAAWSSVLLRLKPDNKSSRNRDIYLLNQICVCRGCGAGKYCIYEEYWGVCGGGEWIPVTSHPNCSRSRLQGPSTTSAVHIPLRFDTCCLPRLRSQLEYISPRCCLN